MPFRVPTHVTLSPGCFARLPGVAAALGTGSALLVSDEGLRGTPWPEQARTALREHGFDVFTSYGTEPNPRHTTVDALAGEARAAGVSLVIGLGGGSVLDAAKAVAMLVTNPGSCVDYEGRNRFSARPVPFVAVPTTCGTGSEVTWVSVITHAGEQRKMSLKGEAMFPDAALVDADLLATLPPHLVAYTGLDALTHALEAYTCTEANPISDVLAERAVGLLFQFLRRAVQDIAGDAEAREAVMRAATLAGLAFGNADVAAVHCLSETIGGIWDVPHGLANALLLAPVFRYHLEARAVHEPLARLYTRVVPSTMRTTSVDDDATRMIERIETLVGDLGLPAFSTLGIDPDQYPRIARGAVRNNSNGSNPRPMHEADYEAILQRL
jgi:alcohol dehydrogenase